MPSDIKQHTIVTPVSLEGIGLHTGSPAKLVFHPAPANSGIVFRRTDLPGQPVIPAHLNQVTKVTRGTTLGNEHKVHTVEHVLSAVHGLGIDNLLIDISGEEPPACDGSSKVFVELLRQSGRQVQDAPLEVFGLKEVFWIEEADRMLSYVPSERFEVTFTVEYPNPSLPRQTRHVVLDPADYADKIGFARTFGFMNEYQMLQSKGLAKGGSLENAIVIGDDGKVLNEGGLRHPDECVLHKILDLIGDMALTGKRLKGHFIAHKTGHAMHVKFAKLLCEKLQKQEERKNSAMMNVEAIKEILPHRYPFLLVDRILTIDPGKMAVGIKNVTANEQFFNGHFPQKPVMPGVLIVEAMAQVAGVLFLSLPEHKGKLPFFVGIDRVRFRKPVVPGDRLEFTVRALRVRGNTGKVEAEAKVDSELVCDGELMFTIL